MSAARDLCALSSGDPLVDLINDLDAAVLVLDPDDRILAGSHSCAELLETTSRFLPGSDVYRFVSSMPFDAGLPRLLAETRAQADRPRSALARTSKGQELLCRARPSARRPELLLLTLEPAPETRPLLADAELTHRVRNSLQMISALVSAYEREGSADGYAAIRAHLSGVAALYDVMADAGRDGAVLADLLLERLAAPLRDSLLGAGSLVALRVEAEPLVLQSGQASSVAVILNELVTNSVKYALTGGRGEITLVARRAGGEIVVGVRDSGPGAPEGARPSVGSRCVAALARQLGGRIERDHHVDGYSVNVVFPASRGEWPARRPTAWPPFLSHQEPSGLPLRAAVDGRVGPCAARVGRCGSIEPAAAATLGPEL